MTNPERRLAASGPKAQHFCLSALLPVSFQAARRSREVLQLLAQTRSVSAGTAGAGGACPAPCCSVETAEPLQLQVGPPPSLPQQRMLQAAKDLGFSSSEVWLTGCRSMPAALPKVMNHKVLPKLIHLPHSTRSCCPPDFTLSSAFCLSQ